MHNFDIHNMDIEFFELLYQDPQFCAMLGKVILSSGRFEGNLRRYLSLNQIKSYEQEGFGGLIGKLERNKLISEKGIQVLRHLKLQRNYLTHSLFDLFSGQIEETLLQRKNLFPSDTATFTEKAWELEQNLRSLNEILEKKLVEGNVKRKLF